MVGARAMAGLPSLPSRPMPDAANTPASEASAAHVNHLGQPVGAPLPGWRPPPLPPRERRVGAFCLLEPLAPGHAGQLFDACSHDREGRMWTYLADGPYADLASYRAWLEPAAASQDPLFQALIDARSGRALGVGAWMRIDPGNGVIEIGHLAFSPLMQRTPMASEALILMIRTCFALGYRRVEWKCNDLNQPSRRAAERLGFRYEGTFRQAVVAKGRNRDTAWYAITDGEWPALDLAHRRWLAPANFDDAGGQRERLGALVALARAQR
jgi:RimJ/RimL family protein N-acetyltransferase